MSSSPWRRWVFHHHAGHRVGAVAFTYCRTWAGWVHVAFIVDIYSQRIVAWYAQTTKHVELVMIPLRMTLWERHRAPPDRRTRQ